MKYSYLYTFLLLLLLLVDNSRSKLGARSSLRSGLISRGWRSGVGSNSQWDSTVNNVEQQQQFSPKHVKGLSQIKDYFSNFGFLVSSPPFNDFLNQETATAIKTYQQFFNLNPTADLTNETFHQISLPRCGVPDINLQYDVRSSSVSWPKAGNRWFSGKNLSYGFSPASEIPANATRLFRNAFLRWEKAVAGLNLTEARYDEADIRVGFYNLDEGVEDVVWGESVVRLQHGVATGEIRLDASKDWKLGGGNGSVLDLESAAMHHIGHLLGLDHSNVEDSVMYPYVLPSRQPKVELSNFDKATIRRVYSKGSCGYARGVLVRIIITFALAFAVVGL
ncbi:hypothetical protein VNO78_03350 [Psophocarpus tetragonolobus]|uniref:Peptidase metallopeptidase domain-containing protein n=1 Tax=Psophocarpus tetragonolobus TaxID=3891 RepID=A0AAN9T0E6_PSOTE